jgi:hypothetical protein
VKNLSAQRTVPAESLGPGGELPTTDEAQIARAAARAAGRTSATATFIAPSLF